MATVAIVNEQDVVTAEIFIAAPPARVFEAITDPAQMSRWWGQNDMYRIKETQSDLRVGGKWSSVGEAAGGKSFRIDGEYLELDPPAPAGANLACQLDRPHQNRRPLGA